MKGDTVQVDELGRIAKPVDGCVMASVWPLDFAPGNPHINEGKICSLCGKSLQGVPIPLLVTTLTITGDYCDVRLCLDCADRLKRIMEMWTHDN
jgi:hypothetical protein